MGSYDYTYSKIKDLPELTALRKPNSKTFLLPDGKFGYLAHCKPVHYFEPFTDNLRTIDLTIRDDGLGNYLVDKSQASIGFRQDKDLSKMIGLRHNNDNKSQFELTPVVLKTDGFAIKLPSIFKSITVDNERYRVIHEIDDTFSLFTQLHECWIRSGLKVNKSITNFEIQYQVDIVGYSLVNGTDKSGNVIPTSDGEFLFEKVGVKGEFLRIKPPKVWTDTDFCEHRGEHTLTLVDGVFSYTKYSTPEIESWLLERKDSPPFYVDSDVTYYSETSDGYWKHDYYSCYYRKDTEANSVSDSVGNPSNYPLSAINSYRGRSAFVFDTSGLDTLGVTNGMISSATFSFMPVLRYTGDVVIVEGTFDVPLVVGGWNDFNTWNSDYNPPSSYSGEFGHVDSVTEDVYADISFNSLGISKIDVDGTTKLVGMNYTYDYLATDGNCYGSTSDAWCDCHFADYTGTSCDPKLYIEYSTSTTYNLSVSTSITLYETYSKDTSTSITLENTPGLETPSSITLETSNTLETPSSISIHETHILETETSITLGTTTDLETQYSITLQTSNKLETQNSITLSTITTLDVDSSISTESPGIQTLDTSITLQTTDNKLETTTSISLYETYNSETPASITLNETYTLDTTTSITLETTPTISTPTSITLQTTETGTGVQTSISLYETHTLEISSSITLSTTNTLETPTSITLKTLSNTTTTPVSITIGESIPIETPTSITLQKTSTSTTPTSITLTNTYTKETSTSITLQKTETIETVSSISTTNTYTLNTISSITLTTTYWRCPTSDNYHSHCGNDEGHTIEEALDGTNYWKHLYNHTHWFILDLGKNYKITKVKGWSDYGTSDPTDIDIYVSRTNGNWSTAVKENITSWQNTMDYVEEDTTPKVGRYVKVNIIGTESSSNYLVWGDSSQFMPIFCIYGTPIITQTLNIDTSIHIQNTIEKETPTSITLIHEDIPLETPTSITLYQQHTLDTSSSIHIVSAGSLNTDTSITLQTTPTLDTPTSISLSGTNTQTTPTSISIYETYTESTPTSITLSHTYTATTPTSITLKTISNPATTPTSISIYETYTITTPTSIVLYTTTAPGVTTSITTYTTGTITTTSSITLYDNVDLIINRKTPILDYTTDDCTYIPTTAALNLTDTVTLEIEINPDMNSSDEKYLLYKNNRYKLTLGDGTHSYPSFGVYVDGAWRTVNTGESIDTDTWSHLAGTYSKTTRTLSIFCDGVLKNTNELSGLGSYEIGST